ncbi:MAG: 3'-5' exonuclease, partial [Myxococcota bacterium]
YSWRGADPSNILDFERTFPGATVVKLEQNYRSTPTILAAANHVIANNTKRLGKTLWSDRPDGTSIALVYANEPEGEAKFVALEIAELHKAGWSNRDIAILYRSNVQSRVLEEELRTARLPYVMYGGQQFFERKEVKDVIAYLRLALNPRDEIALRRIVNYPSRGIGTTTLKKVAEAAQAARTTMWTVLEQAGERLPDLRAQTAAAIADFAEIIVGVREPLDAGQNPAIVARNLVEKIGLYDDLRNAAPSASAAQRRIDNVESLFNSLERHYQRKPGRTALLEYLRQLSLASDSDDKSDPGNKIVLTTLHGAKGLEFPVVFMIGLEEEILPHARTLAPQATDVFDPDHASDISEERRLMYVGITRAMDKLYLSRSILRRYRGRTAPRIPSRFLSEIPEELITKRYAAAVARAPADEDEVRALFQSLMG